MTVEELYLLLREFPDAAYAECEAALASLDSSEKAAVKAVKIRKNLFSLAINFSRLSVRKDAGGYGKLFVMQSPQFSDAAKKVDPENDADRLVILWNNAYYWYKTQFADKDAAEMVKARSFNDDARVFELETKLSAYDEILGAWKRLGERLGIPDWGMEK